jgi:hypothetical protein
MPGAHANNAQSSPTPSAARVTEREVLRDQIEFAEGHER